MLLKNHSGILFWIDKCDILLYKLSLNNFLIIQKFKAQVKKTPH